MNREDGTPAGARIARVVVVSPLPHLDHEFEYLIPSDLAERVRPGARVKVPFGTRRRPLDGYVIGVRDAPSFAGELAAISKVVGELPVLAPDVWRLARAVADRQGGVASDVLRLAIPPRHAHTEKAWIARGVAVDWSEDDDWAGQDDRPAGREGAQRPSSRRAEQPEPGVEERYGPDVPRWVELFADRVIRLAGEGRGSITCVPDWRDLDLLESVISRREPDLAVARFEARLAVSDRYLNFLRARSGEALIVIGTRSAVYAPARRLGLIQLWDDGDPMYREPRAPYAHAREVALLRQHQSGCELVFSAHTRSLATQRLVELGWCVAGPTPPHPLVVPTADVIGQEQEHGRIPEAAWRVASEALHEGPVLVQVSTPGYFGFVACATCGERALCPRCGGPIRQASRGPATCRWCSAPVPRFTCQACGGHDLRHGAPGSARTAMELGRSFPRVPVVQATGADVVRTVRHVPQLVVATPGAEPVAEGGYRAVLLLDGPRMLMQERPTAADDALRHWFNAASLAAPGATVALVGVSGRLARSLASWRPELYASPELRDRAQLALPPAVRTCLVTGRPGTVMSWLDACGLPDDVDAFGPVAFSDGDGATAEFALLKFPYRAAVVVGQSLKAQSTRRAGIRYRFDALPQELWEPEEDA